MAAARNIARHFCAIMGFVGDMVYVLDYTDLVYPDTPKKIKFPGGNQEGNERPEETAVREAREEIGEDIDWAGMNCVHERRVNPSHTQYYFAKVFTEPAVVRDWPMQDDDGLEQISAPRLMPIWEALRVLHKPHADALASFLAKVEEFQATKAKA